MRVLKRNRVNLWLKLAVALLLGLLALTASIQLVQADGPIYVDADYTGVETGSETQPFNTIQEAHDASQTAVASTIYIKAGTTNPYAGFTVTKGGADGDHPDLYTVWPGSGAYPKISADAANLITFSADYVVIDGLEVDGSAGASTRDLVTSTSGGEASHITIRNCKVHHSSGDEGIQLKNAPYSRIENVESYSNDGDGINLCSGSDHSVVTNNYSHDNRGAGPPHGGFYFYNVSDLTITDNVSARNREAGIHFDDTVSQVLVQNNLIISTTIHDPGEAFGIWLHHNADLSHITLVNNTIVDSQFDGIRLSSGQYITITDNIVTDSGSYGLNNSGALTVSNDYNLVWNNGAADWSGAITGAHSMSLDPLFSLGSQGVEPGYYLSQVAAGQANDSAALDAGSRTAAAAGLDSLSTRTDGGNDASTVDLGYHYDAFPAQVIMSANPITITANGVSTSTLTAQVKTVTGNPVSDGVTVVFTTSLGTFENWEAVYTTTTSGGAANAVLRSLPSQTQVLAPVGGSADPAAGDTVVTEQPPACSAEITNWTEHTGNPIFGEGVDDGPKAYYPAVVYSPTAFDGHGDASYYKMWYGTSESRTGYATSPDGIQWTVEISKVTNINGYHAHVLYDAGRFGDDSAYYKMWYWDVSSSVNYATSDDGISWTNYAGNPVITNALAWGSAPVYDAFVIYNTDSQPAAYEAWIDNNGKFYYITSADGISWSGDNQELLTDRQSWESVTYSRASVLKQNGAYHMWYGGGSSGGGNHGIGYAVSPDGQHWMKSLDNPLLAYTDGPAWRDNRSYTPRVLYSATRFDGHGSPENYKMWFTGKDNTEGNYALGFASLNPVSLSLADTSGSGQENTTGAVLQLPFVAGLRDACGSPAEGVWANFAISGTPTDAVGASLSLITGTTDISGQISSLLTLGDKAGVYTITTAADGVLNMPTVFTATARGGQPEPDNYPLYLPIVRKEG